MADLQRGKTIFENRLEQHPLPKKTGVRDDLMFTLAFYTEEPDADLADFGRAVFLNFVAPRQGRPLHLNACAR
jgi:hypothetical protein